MEFTLHRQLKERFGTDRGGLIEVIEGPYRADAIAPDGAWVEVQSGALGPLRRKLESLLPGRRVQVVKPIVIEKRIIRTTTFRGEPSASGSARPGSSRLSPRRGALVEVFEDLVGLIRLFPHPNLSITVLGVAIDEVRLPVRRGRRRRAVVRDRLLRELRQDMTLAAADDLWRLLPEGLDEPFSTLDLAAILARPIGFAQRVAYCLRLSGAAVVLGKRGNRLVYQRAGSGVRSRIEPDRPRIAAVPALR